MFRKALVFILTLVILVSISSIVTWAIINGLIGHLNSIPLTTRQGYETTFDSYIGAFLAFLSMSMVVYYLTIFFFTKISNAKYTKMYVGIIAGLLPITILFSITFGLPYSNLGSQVYFLILAIAGGFIPIVEKRLHDVFFK